MPSGEDLDADAYALLGVYKVGDPIVCLTPPFGFTRRMAASRRHAPAIVTGDGSASRYLDGAPRWPVLCLGEMPRHFHGLRLSDWHGWDHNKLGRSRRRS